MPATVASFPANHAVSPSAFNRFFDVAPELAATGRELAARGWVPATSGNFSLRLDRELIAITASGKDKGALSEQDILLVDLDGHPITEGKPSAETGLHTQLYRHASDIGAVLHTHSATATLVSRYYGRQGGLHLENLELLKAFRGVTSHETSLFLPIVGNDQSIPRLAASVAPYLEEAMLPAYLIEGHGTYVWGRDLAEARRHLEALEFLLQCQWEFLKLKR